MLVVRAVAFGGPEVLVAGEAADPVPGPGQVLIEVAVAAINFVQTQLRGGHTPGPPLPVPPYIPGSGVAGRVAGLGTGVPAEWAGRRVVTRTAGGSGGNAELAVAEVADLLPVPDELSLTTAAALLEDGNTALGLHDLARIEAGDRVLVEAAAGGVGSLLVQLARDAGARVIGASRGARKLAVARELGAATTVDYATPDWARVVREATGGAGVDVAFDGVGGPVGRTAFDLVRTGGRFVPHGAAGGSMTMVDPPEARRRDVTVTGLTRFGDLPETRAQRVARAMAATVAGRLRPIVGQTFPLASAADAHAAMESRATIGKTLLIVQREG